MADQRGDLGIIGMVHHLVRCIALQCFPAVYDAQPVGNAARFVQVVGNVDDRPPELLPQGDQFAHQFPARLLVHGGKRLIQQ